MELYFGEYKHVQQEYGVHLRLESDETKKSRLSQNAKTGSYGVSIRVQGIDGHPYIVLNNTERCLAGVPFVENGPPFTSPAVNDLPLCSTIDPRLEEKVSEEIHFPENPYAQSSAFRSLKPASLYEGKNGLLDHKKSTNMLNFQRHPEILQPYNPEKNELKLETHRSPEHNWTKTPTDETRIQGVEDNRRVLGSSRE